jgi:hypothetical protein
VSSGRDFYLDTAARFPTFAGAVSLTKSETTAPSATPTNGIHCRSGFAVGIPKDQHSHQHSKTIFPEFVIVGYFAVVASLTFPVSQTPALETSNSR